MKPGKKTENHFFVTSQKRGAPSSSADEFFVPRHADDGAPYPISSAKIKKVGRDLRARRASFDFPAFPRIIEKMHFFQRFSERVSDTLSSFLSSTDFGNHPSIKWKGCDLRFFRTLFIPGIILILLITGCGGGGGSSSGSLELVLVPIKIFREGSSSSQGLFASVKGDGVTGGRLEDPQRNQIANSDLDFEYTVNRYQIILESPSGSFISGNYFLMYFVNGETKEYQAQNIEWATIPDFNTAFNISWNPNSRYLTVSAPTIPGNVEYYLELYDSNSGFFRRKTDETKNPSSIVEFVSDPGEFRVAVVADIIEASKVKAKATYFFKDTLSTF